MHRTLSLRWFSSGWGRSQRAKKAPITICRCAPRLQSPEYTLLTFPSCPPPGPPASYIANDTASPAGMAAALAAIVAVAAEQMGGEAMRAHFQIDQCELTGRVLPLQAVLLIAAAPLLDKLLVGNYPHQYEFHVPSMARGAAACRGLRDHKSLPLLSSSVFSGLRRRPGAQ